jgi:hypothetical protein
LLASQALFSCEHFARAFKGRLSFSIFLQSKIARARAARAQLRSADVHVYL